MSGITDSRANQLLDAMEDMGELLPPIHPHTHTPTHPHSHIALPSSAAHTSISHTTP
jgi:hypothetical protein